MKDNENSLLLNWFFGSSQEPRPQIQILDPWTLGAFLELSEGRTALPL